MSTQSVHDVLSLYPAGYTPASWHDLGDSAGFSGAIIVRLETVMGTFCLRGWPIPSLPRERILGLHRLLTHVLQRGFCEVPVPVPALNGETLVMWNGQQWQIEPWKPGHADFWSHPSSERLRDVMARIARFHQFTRDYQDTGPARSWFYHEDQAISPAVKERLAYLTEWQETKIHQLKAALNTETNDELRELGRELASRFDRMALLIGSKLEFLSRVRFRLQPCLRDLWHDHVLFTGEKVTGLVDPAACRSENIAADLARLLGSLLKDDKPTWDLALEEYERHRPLESNEKALVESLDQSGVLLSGLAWMDRLVINRNQVANLGKVVARVQSICERLRSLDESLAKTLFS